ncbi:MAG: sel1 repeat family protein [Betaproteobacteria bacterium]|nr:sel1 repeat family protein [Betaproteobacteria bacterium]
MTGIKSYGAYWRSSAAIALVLGIGMGLANAGPEEDFANGMISYRRADFVTAMPLLRKAADAGHAEAQVVLASILDAAESDEEAVAYYRKAAAAGNLDGIYGLGVMLGSGEGVKKDVGEAKILITRAAEAGHKQAIRSLAQVYMRGELEITEEQRKGPEALKWITLAADDNFMPALETLEKAYRDGEYGLAPDAVKADELKRKIAAMKGVKDNKKRRRGEKQ